MGVNLDALSVVNPDLGGSLDTRLPHTAHVERAQNAPASTTEASMGYGPTPATVPPAVVVGPFPCQFAPYKTRDGKQVMTSDLKVVVSPWEVVFRAADGALIKARDRLTIGAKRFSVIAPPQVGSFDVLVSAVCQEVS